MQNLPTSSIWGRPSAGTDPHQASARICAIFGRPEALRSCSSQRHRAIQNWAGAPSDTSRLELPRPQGRRHDRACPN
eukprot:715135-Pyramimonas_sp.AAC.1